MIVIGDFKMSKNSDLKKYKKLINICKFANLDIIVINNIEKKTYLDKNLLQNLIIFSELHSTSLYIYDNNHNFKHLTTKNINLIVNNIKIYYIFIVNKINLKNINIIRYFKNNMNHILKNNMNHILKK